MTLHVDIPEETLAGILAKAFCEPLLRHRLRHHRC